MEIRNIKQIKNYFNFNYENENENDDDNNETDKYKNLKVIK